MGKLALIPIAALFIAALPLTAATGCEAPIAAALKVFQVPAHLYMTETAAFNGGKARNAETIYLNGATFIMVSGRWRKSAVPPENLMASKKESEAKAGICTVVRDEAVNGEAATLYKIHNQTPDDTVDTQLWVSKSRGLPLKQINDMDLGGTHGKSHTEIRYEYTNVTAPAVTELRHK